MERRDHTRSSIILFFSYLSVFLMGLVAGVALVHESEGVQLANTGGTITVSMSIDYGAEDIQALPVDTVVLGTTLEQYLGVVMSRHGVPIDVRRIGGAVYVESFHGVHASSFAGWRYATEYGDEGTDPRTYTLKDGDKITWTLKGN